MERGKQMFLSLKGCKDFGEEYLTEWSCIPGRGTLIMKENKEMHLTMTFLNDIERSQTQKRILKGTVGSKIRQRAGSHTKKTLKT